MRGRLDSVFVTDLSRSPHPHFFETSSMTAKHLRLCGGARENILEASKRQAEAAWPRRQDFRSVGQVTRDTVNVPCVLVLAFASTSKIPSTQNSTNVMSNELVAPGLVRVCSSNIPVPIVRVSCICWRLLVLYTTPPPYIPPHVYLAEVRP